TWGDDDTSLFVVHHDKDDAVLGLAVAWLGASVGEPIAKQWAVDNLRQIQRIPVGEWRQVGEDPRSWWTLDLNANRWFLRRHNDVWLLVMAETNIPKVSGPELIEWAEGSIELRYEVQPGSWQIGPGTGAPGTSVFYFEAKGGVTRKDRSEQIKRAIAE